MYFCAVGLIVLLPFAFLFCQVLTFVIYEGAWRWRCLAPLPLVAATFCLLIWFQTPVAFVTVMIAAPTVGMLALGCVWGLYSRAAAKRPDPEPVGGQAQEG